MKRRWFLLVGLILGVAAGLLYAWQLNPVEYYDTYPPLMRSDFRMDWIRMVALAHAGGMDLERAQVLLHDLSGNEIETVLADALDEAVAEGRDVVVLQRVAQLASAYGLDTTAVRIYTEEVAVTQPSLATPLPTPAETPAATPTPTSSVTPTPTPLQQITLVLPTATPTPEDAITATLPIPTLAPPRYVIIGTVTTCAPEPRIAVSVTQEVTVTVRGREQWEIQGLPGVEVWLLWTEGADRAVTGLRPGMGLGYADFLVEPGQTYNLYIESPTGAPVAVVNTGDCGAGEEDAWTSWLVILKVTGGE
ncbi:MAG: hypothetical protein JXB35_16335 [Anaerolineae bacterium]|nr:hypothetical protein [Anaerolineae bacterium]